MIPEDPYCLKNILPALVLTIFYISTNIRTDRIEANIPHSKYAR